MIMIKCAVNQKKTQRNRTKSDLLHYSRAGE